MTITIHSHIAKPTDLASVNGMSAMDRWTALLADKGLTLTRLVESNKTNSGYAHKFEVVRVGRNIVDLITSL